MTDQNQRKNNMIERERKLTGTLSGYLTMIFFDSPSLSSISPQTDTGQNQPVRNQQNIYEL